MSHISANPSLLEGPKGAAAAKVKEEEGGGIAPVEEVRVRVDFWSSRGRFPQRFLRLGKPTGRSLGLYLSLSNQQ